MTEDFLQTQDRRSGPASSGNAVWVVALLGLLIAGVGAWYWYAGQSNEDGLVDLTDASVTDASVADVSVTGEEGDASTSDVRDRTANATTQVAQALEVTEEVVTTPTPTAPVEAPPPALPALEASDEFVREQINSWGLPDLQQQDALLSRLSAFIASAADGLVPKRQLKSFVPSRKFSVSEVGEYVYLDPESYARYDSYLDMLERVSPQVGAAFLHQVEPLLMDGLADLGDSRSPESLIEEAIGRLEDLPNLPAEIELTRKRSVYVYTDERFESLPEFEKQILRLGPDNIERLRAWVNQFAQAYTRR